MNMNRNWKEPKFRTVIKRSFLRDIIGEGEVTRLESIPRQEPQGRVTVRIPVPFL